jgi:hypothetical protein
MLIDVASNERVFLYVDNKPVRYLGPGQFSESAWFRKLHIVRVNTNELVADLDEAQLALVPATDLQVVEVATQQRALVTRRGKPARWLGVGQHQVWTVDRLPVRQGDAARVSQGSTVQVELIDVSAVEAKPLRDELRPLVPASDYVETTAPEGFVQLRFVDGKLDTVLPPGRHAAWNVAHKVTFSALEVRERLIHLAGQEVMTRDRVSLRLNLAAAFRVVDPRKAATVARSIDDAMYLAMQLASREAVGGQTLDVLLEARDGIGAAIQAEVVKRAADLGAEVVSFGIKDVVLPGEMKELLNRVIQAQKEAEANVIFRREETAATRSMAQTAKVLAENPLLVRLKELEAYKDLAGKVGTIHVVLGDGKLPGLQLKAD